MPINIEISNEDIIEQIKSSYQYSEILKQVTIRKIIESESKRVGIQITKKELQGAADDFRIKNGLTSARNTQTWLDINHFSLDDFEEVIRTELLTSKLKHIIIQDKVEEYFCRNASDFDRAVLYEVIFNNKELANELFYAVKASEIRFQDVVNRYMTDIELKRKGGYIGEIQRKDLDKTFSSVFADFMCPKVLKPIPTKLGFHLIWVEEVIKSSLDLNTYAEIANYLFKQHLKNRAEEI